MVFCALPILNRICSLWMSDPKESGNATEETRHCVELMEGIA